MSRQTIWSKRKNQSPEVDLLHFLQSLVRSSLDGLSRNKLAATLSLIALVLTTALALTSDYDERPRYRKLILPEIHKAEQQFFTIMQAAEDEQNELWRLHYFLEGHRRAKAALRVVRAEHPMTPAGRKAQRELARYYDQEIRSGKILIAVEEQGPDAAGHLERARQILANSGAVFAPALASPVS